MKKKIINGLLMVALVAGTTSSFVSCKDYDDDVKAQLRGEFNDQIEDLLNKHNQDIAQLRNSINTNVDNLQDQINQLKKNNGDCDCPENVAARLTELERKVSNILASEIWTADLSRYVTNEKLTNVILANYVTNEKLQEELKKLPTSQGGGLTEDQVKALLVDFLTVDELADYAKKGDLFNKTELNKYLLRGDFEAEFDKVFAAEKEALEQLIATEIENVKNDVNEALNNLITSIIIQGTYNPIFGSISAPLDVRSTVFGAFYGKTGQDGAEFPATKARFYADQDGYIVTAEDLAAIGQIDNPVSRGAKAVLINEAQGNAGTIYVTVNPSDVNFSGTEFKLVDSQDNEALFSVGKLNKSEKLLVAGWDNTRAAHAGFYEAPVTLSADNLEDAKLVIDVTNLEGAAKDVINKRDKNSLVSLASELYTTASGIQLPYNALKATWNDARGEHSVYSQYSVVATAIKPLSYAFSINIQKIPGIERLENLIGNVINSIDLNGIIPNINIDPKDLEFNGIDLSGKTFTITVNIDKEVVANIGNITVPASTTTQTLHLTSGDEDVNITIPAQTVNVGDRTIKIQISQDADITGAVNDLAKELNNALPMDALSDALSSLKDLANVNSKIDQTKADIKNKIVSYIDKFNNVGVKLVNSVNAALQPTLLFDTTTGLKRVTTSPLGSNVQGTSITVYPTSFTAELLAPAYKKLVAVTNITTDGVAQPIATVKALNEANGLNHVLDGDVQAVNIEGLEAGNVYEILYTAIDYSGLVVAKKYYLNVQ